MNSKDVSIERYKKIYVARNFASLIPDLRMAFVRNDRFITTMNTDKKIIVKIDGTTKNSFRNGIIGSVSDFTSIIKKASIVDVVIKNIGKRFFDFNLINMNKARQLA